MLTAATVSCESTQQQENLSVSRLKFPWSVEWHIKHLYGVPTKVECEHRPWLVFIHVRNVGYGMRTLKANSQDAEAVGSFAMPFQR